MTCLTENNKKERAARARAATARLLLNFGNLKFSRISLSIFVPFLAMQHYKCAAKSGRRRTITVVITTITFEMYRIIRPRLSHRVPIPILQKAVTGFSNIFLVGMLLDWSIPTRKVKFGGVFAPDITPL